MNSVTLLLLCALLQVPVTQSASGADAKTTIDTLLSGYDLRLRPVDDQTKPVYVTVEFNLIGIIAFDEVAEKLSAAGFFTLTWNDASFSWSNSSGLFYVKIPETQVWKPDLVNSNTLAQLKNIGDGERQVAVNYEGLVIYQPGDIFNCSCSVDVTYYPYDTQNCQIDFITWNYFHEEVQLILGKDTINMDVYEENGSWQIMSTSAVSEIKPIEANTSVNFLHFKVEMQRRTSFYIQTQVLPAVLLNILSFFIFLLPPQSGEKVSFGIAMFLSVAVFITFISGSIPQTSKTTSIFVVYLSTVMVLAGTHVLVAIVCVYVYNKENNSSIPSCLQKLILKRKQGRAENKEMNEKDISRDNEPRDGPAIATWQDVAIILDMFCFLFFLVTAILLTAIVFGILTLGH